MNKPPVELRELGKTGIVFDIAPDLLETSGFSNGKNVRFTANGVSRFPGHSDAFGELGSGGLEPEFIFNVSGLTGSFWIYCSLAEAWVYEGGVHAEITRTSGGNYTTANGYDWQGTVLGGVPILNNGADIPQYWDELNSSTPLAPLTNWPSTLRAKIVKAFGPYLMLYNLTESTNLLPKAFRWSHFTDPGSIPDSYDYTDATKDAGRAELTDEKGGEILEAIQLGNQMVVYTTGSTHVQRIVGGQDIIGTDLLLRDSGILWSKCACSFAKGTKHCVLTVDDVIVHAGTKDTESILEDKDRDYLFSVLDQSFYKSSFVFENSRRQEVWICIPTSGSPRPNLACVWNYRYNTITFRDFNLVSVDAGPLTDSASSPWAGDTQPWDEDETQWSTERRKLVIGVSKDDEAAYLLDSGYAFGDSTVRAFVERTGLTIDGMKNGKPTTSIQSRKLVTRVWPKVRAQTGCVLQIRIGAQERYNGAITWLPYQDFDPATMSYLDFVTGGKFLAYNVENTQNIGWVLEGFDFELDVTSQL
jgi:hypothetical protein